MQAVVASALQPESGWISNPVAGGLEDQPLDWHELDLRVLPLTGGPFQFHVERLHRGNDAYYSRLGEAAKLKNAEQAVAATVQAQAEARETSLSPQPVEEQIQEQKVTPPVLQLPHEAEQIDLAPPQRDSPVCSPTAFTGSVSNNHSGAAAIGAAPTPQQVDPVAPPSPVPVSVASLLYPDVASAPPGLTVQHVAPAIAARSQQLFAEHMQLDEQPIPLNEHPTPLNEYCEPLEPVVPEEEYEAEPTSQCTPVPADAPRPPKLSIRTHMEGVPELHQSALRDTPSHAIVPPADMCPPTHIAGVPETNVHLPVPGMCVLAIGDASPQCLPPTPPSQMEGVPEVHLSAWAPLPQPRLTANEQGDGMAAADAAVYVANENSTPAASPPDTIHAAASASAPRSRITRPSPAPSFAYAIPDHPVLLRSNPSPVLSPRSQLIRESMDGDDSPANALTVPRCAGMNSSHPSMAEGSISLNEPVEPMGPAGGSNAEVSAGPWYMVPSGLTPEGYMNAAVGTTPVNFPLPQCELEQGMAPSSDPPSAGTRQRRAATGAQSKPLNVPSGDARVQRGRSAKRKSDAAGSVEGGSSKKTRSAVRSVAADAAAPQSHAQGSGSAPQHSKSSCSGKGKSAHGSDYQQKLPSEVGAAVDARQQYLAPVAELTEKSLGVHDGRRWGPAGEGCSRWFETNSGAGAACDAGPENDRQLWCGDDFGGDDFGDNQGYESEDFPEDPLCTPLDERETSKSRQTEVRKQTALAAVAANDDTTPIPADFAADSEQHHDPVGNGVPSGGAQLPFVQSVVVADGRQHNAHSARKPPKSILKTGKSSGSAARASKYSGDKENVPGSGNAVDKRTPHFAPLPPSGGGENFSDRSRGPGESDEDASQSQKPSQEGDENQGNKKMSRAAKSLMSKHLRRKSLAMAGTKEVDGRRVSTRRKMKPLRWWCSESKTYCRKHQSLPTVTAVIRTEQKSAQYRGLKNPADSFQAHTEAWGSGK